MPSHSPRHTIQANNMKSKHAATHSYADLYRKAYITNLDFPGCVRFSASIIPSAHTVKDPTCVS